MKNAVFAKTSLFFLAGLVVVLASCAPSVTPVAQRTLSPTEEIATFMAEHDATLFAQFTETAKVSKTQQAKFALKASPTSLRSHTPRPTSTPKFMFPTTPVYPPAVDLFELLEAGSVEVFNVVAEDINDLKLTIKSNVDYPLSVWVPAGTYFVSKSRRYQDLISTETETGKMASKRDVDILDLEVASANIDKRIPDEDVDYLVLNKSFIAELDAAMPFIEEANLRYESNQALIWILTDDASYEELGILVDISPSLSNPFPLDNPRRVIDADHVVAAFQVLDKAGIDITSHKIWLDRDSLAGELEDDRQSALNSWLQDYIQDHIE